MIVLACEGNTELILMEFLLNEGALVFTRHDLLDRRPFHIRQLKDIKSLIQTLPHETNIEVYRVGDTQKDNWDLSPFSSRVKAGCLHIHRICTKPEIEMLEIIAYQRTKEYDKAMLGPKSFVKSEPDLPSRFEDFIDSVGLDGVIEAIHEYKRVKKNERDEGYLADLLKK